MIRKESKMAKLTKSKSLRILKTEIQKIKRLKTNAAFGEKKKERIKKVEKATRRRKEKIIKVLVGDTVKKKKVKRKSKKERVTIFGLKTLLTLLLIMAYK